MHSPHLSPLRSLALCIISVITLGDHSTAGAELPFSQDSAYATLAYLVDSIGPRTMGSPAEQNALAFAIARLRDNGCDEAYLMPMHQVGGINTSSGIAVGVLPGKTGRIIIIGAHIDTSDPFVPGACDDGSGIACVIELARVFSKRENASTILVCCWGGEEQNLLGSRYFVEHFSSLDSVVLMIQLDMADGAGFLEVYPDAGDQVSSPRWLTEAAFDVFYDELHYAGLRYPTQFATINASLGDGAGSDHMPFLEKGIPAIAFVSEVAYPVHTPQDNLQSFTPMGLKRSGDLVYRLVERFDAGVPGPAAEKYYLVQVGSLPVFISHGVLTIVVALSLLLGVLAIVVAVRRHRRSPGARVRWSGVKVFLLTVIVMTFVWTAETVIGQIQGIRFPWVNNFDWYVVFGIMCGILGLWFVLRLARRLTLAPSSTFFYIRALVLLMVFVGAAAFAGVEIAFYPACALLLVSLATLDRSSRLKWLLVLLSPVMMLMVFFPESLELLHRVLTMIPMRYGARAISNVLYVVVSTIIFLPFAHVLVGAYRDTQWKPRLLRWFPGTSGLLVSVTGTVALAMFLTTRPTYDERWARSVQATQRFNVDADSSTLLIAGGEYLDGLRVTLQGRDSALSGRSLYYEPILEKPSVVPWLSARAATHENRQADRKDSLREVDREVVMHSMIRPLSVRLTYTSTEAFERRSPWASGYDRRSGKDTDRRATFTWYSYPDTLLQVPVTFILRPGQEVVERLEVTYDRLAVPCSFERSLTNVISQTVVTRLDTVRIGS